MNLAPTAPSMTKAQAFTLFEAALMGEPAALEKTAALSGRQLSDFVYWSAQFYTALADAVAVVDGHAPAEDPDLTSPAGREYLGKLFAVLRAPAAA